MMNDDNGNKCFAVITALFVILLSIFVYLWHVQKQKFTIFKNLGIPGPKPSFLIGHTSSVSFDAKRMTETILKWRQEHGNIFGYYPGSKPALMICHLDFVKQVGIKDFAYFSDRFPIPSLLGEHSLFNLHGQRWNVVRKHLSPVFSTSKLRHLVPIMKVAIDNFDIMLKKHLKEDNDCNIYELFRRLALDAIGESALAIKINCQLDEDSQYFSRLKNLSQVTGRANRFVIFWFCFPLIFKLLDFVMTNWHPVHRTCHVISDNLRKVLKVRRSMVRSDLKSVDMMQLMLNASKEVQEVSTDAGPKKSFEELLTDDEIVGNCFIFFFSGFEGVATMLAIISYTLSIHQEVQDKVYGEIMSEVKDLSNVTYDDVSKLHYLSRVIKETFRLYTQSAITNRICSEDYEYAGITIPKGMRIDIPIYLIHHDPDIWPEPENFNPDRFLPENKKLMHPAANYLPFGIGPRNCIAMRFVLLEIKLILVPLLSKYRIVPPTSLKLPPEKTFPTGTMTASNGIYVRVEPRL